MIEGPVLRREYASFVGLHPLPVRHGMTIGEIASYLKSAFYPSLTLHVIAMEGWRREMWFCDTGLPWVLPSPNMPTLETATVYPGMCLLEGTNMSEGRGTTRPFEIFGAPYIDSEALLKNLSRFKIPGAVMRPISFIPTFQKYAGEVCHGAQIHVTDREEFRPFRCAVAILKAAHGLYPDGFKWKSPPYEYESILMPIDILAGTDRVREDIEVGLSLDEMEAWWSSELPDFDEKIRKNFLLY